MCAPTARTGLSRQAHTVCILASMHSIPARNVLHTSSQMQGPTAVYAHAHAHTRILPRHSRTRALGQQCLRPGCPASCVPYMFGHMSPYVDTGLVAHTCLDTCMSSRGHDLRHLGVFVYIADCGRSHSHLCVYGFLSAQSHAWADTGLRRPAHPPPSPAPGPQALAPTPTLSPPCRGRVLQRRADAVSGPAAV